MPEATLLASAAAAAHSNAARAGQARRDGQQGWQAAPLRCSQPQVPERLPAAAAMVPVAGRSRLRNDSRGQHKEKCTSAKGPAVPRAASPTREVEEQREALPAS